MIGCHYPGNWLHMFNLVCFDSVVEFTYTNGALSKLEYVNPGGHHVAVETYQDIIFLCF